MYTNWEGWGGSPRKKKRTPIDILSNPKRHAGVTAKYKSVQDVFNNVTELKRILEYVQFEYPMTCFETEAVEEFEWRKLQEWDSHLYTPTEVCWYWYANWFPTNFCRGALSLSHYWDDYNDIKVRRSGHSKNLWNRLSYLCHSLSIPPSEIVPLPDDGILTRLHTIDMADLTPPTHAPWLGCARVKTRALVHLQDYQNLHTLTMTLDDNEQVVQLSKLTQLKNLDLDFVDDVDNLSALCTLTNIQYLRLRSAVALSGWLHHLTQLRVLETYNARKSLGSMHMFTSLRRYCVESTSSKTYDDNIHTIRRLIRVICNLLTLPPNSNVDIHLPIDPRQFGLLFRTNESTCHELCTSLRKLMYRFGLGFRVIDCDIDDRTNSTPSPLAVGSHSRMISQTLTWLTIMCCAYVALGCVHAVMINTGILTARTVFRATFFRHQPTRSPSGSGNGACGLG